LSDLRAQGKLPPGTAISITFESGEKYYIPITR